MKCANIYIYIYKFIFAPYIPNEDNPERRNECNHNHASDGVKVEERKMRQRLFEDVHAFKTKKSQKLAQFNDLYTCNSFH